MHVLDSVLPAASYTCSMSSSISAYTAAPAGEQCLNDAAAGRPVTPASSRTSCHALSASSRLMYPGVPQSTSNGSGFGPCAEISPATDAGFCCGLQPYLSVCTAVRDSPSCPCIHSAMAAS